MKKYFVNKNAQNTPNKEHEVHTDDCEWFPSDNNYLGQFINCHGAVEKAKEHYDVVDGCKHCCPACHTM